MNHHHADIKAAWQALTERQRQALTQDRIALLRWMKAILKARMPHLHDGPGDRHGLPGGNQDVRPLKGSEMTMKARLWLLGMLLGWPGTLPMIGACLLMAAPYLTAGITGVWVMRKLCQN
jgi:hypothetical protein